MNVEITADDVLTALSAAADERKRYLSALYDILALPPSPRGNSAKELTEWGVEWRDAARRIALDAIGVEA